MTPRENNATASPGASPVAPSAMPPAAGLLRVGTMGGDRPCVRCGFNLRGQPIVREEHYAMLIARCPECGEVAALQEYPALGRWAGRIGGLLAGLWLLFMILFLVASARIAYERVEQSATDVLTPAGLTLATAYREFARANIEKQYPDPAQRAQWTQWWDANPVETYPFVGGEFIADPSFAPLLAGLDLSTGTDWTRGRSAGWIAVAGGCLGAVWSLLCPHTRWRGRMIVATLIAGGVGVFWLWEVAASSNLTPAWGGQMWGPSVAFAKLGGPLVPGGMVLCWVFLVLGQWVGRPVVRWLVVLMLPPRLRAGLGFLWTLHGKPVPGWKRGV